ncbi:MAG: AEC family transporter, partial [Hyphomicrobiales bacterium]|nr:AEC family transporter [Hyphomicrobiales bacterium]
MDVIFTLTLPLFAVVGLGYLAARQGMLGDGAVRSLNAFVFYFALPALLVRTIARQEIADVFVPVYFAGYLVASLLMFAAGALIAKMLRGATLSEMAVSAQSAAVPNIGYLGLPLVLAAYSETSAGPFTMALIVDLLVMFPLAIVLLELSATGKQSGGGLAQGLRGLLLNPFLLSIVAGVMLSL